MCVLELWSLLSLPRLWALPCCPCALRGSQPRAAVLLGDQSESSTPSVPSREGSDTTPGSAVTWLLGHHCSQPSGTQERFPVGLLSLEMSQVKFCFLSALHPPPTLLKCWHLNSVGWMAPCWRGPHGVCWPWHKLLTHRAGWHCPTGSHQTLILVSNQKWNTRFWSWWYNKTVIDTKQKKHQKKPSTLLREK